MRVALIKGNSDYRLHERNQGLDHDYETTA